MDRQDEYHACLGNQADAKIGLRLAISARKKDISGQFIVEVVLLDADNATDEKARHHASFLKEAAPLPGRNVNFSSDGDFLTEWGEFESVHGIAMDDFKHLYTTEIYNRRVQRFDVLN